MNGKVTKMLDRMRRGDHKSKRAFMSLSHTERGEVRQAYRDNVKLAYIDELHRLHPELG